jgi:CubicO group peptidase (beta-lactamase class C family)
MRWGPPAGVPLWIAGLLIVTALPLVAQQAGRDSGARQVDRVFARWSATDRPGCAVGVSRDGQVLYKHGYGMASLEDAVAIQPSTIFQIGSVSKQFTAMALLLLARDGKLSLDDDIRKYIPEMPDYGTRITIRQMLSHTSGIRDEVSLFDFAHGPRYIFTEEDGVALVAQQKALNFTPGAEYLYSNSGFMLAAVIVKRVSGQPLREFAAQRIFGPLGMTRSHIRDDYTEVVPGLATSYRPAGPDGWRLEFPSHNVIGSTNVMTTVGDLLRWADNFAHPVVGDRALLAALQTKSVLTNGDSIGYGLGLDNGMYRGLPTVMHGGADAGYRSEFLRFPTRNLNVVVLCNAASAAPEMLANQVADVYLGMTGAARPDSVSPASVSPDVLASRAGVYVNRETGRVLRLSVRDGQLVQGRARPSNGPGGAHPIPLSADRFRLGGGTEMVFSDPTHLELRMVYPPRVTDRLERVPAFDPKPGQLAEYAGEYYSEELGTTYTLTATDTALLAKPRIAGGEPFTVYPAAKDVFDGGPVVQFTRDASGKINGMLLTVLRSRHMRFVRVRR